jgi:hypothetical protein
MNTYRIIRLALAVALCFAAGSYGISQVTADVSKPVATPPSLPLTTQMKKTVLFITTSCVHQPTPDELSRNTPEVLAKMTPKDREEWSIEVSQDLTPERLAKMSPIQKAKLRIDTVVGTGFIVGVSDERMGKDQSFAYLVTNRHVAQPGIEHGMPCKQLAQFVSMNHLGDSPNAPVHVQPEPIPQTTPWYYSEDQSVDLAIIPVNLELKVLDMELIPISMFATSDMIERHEIVEGDPVLFAALFMRYSGVSRMEPVVRSGTIAMLPGDPITTTLGKPGRIYFAEVHAFGGNSGSPMFVDINKFKTGFGSDYRFLGVVTGIVNETSNFTLQVTTSLSANIAANSGVSTIVPADQVKAILDSAPLKQRRDEAVAKFGPKSQ